MPENCRFVRRLNLVRVTGGHETFLKNYTLGPRAHKFLPASLSLSLPSPPSPSLLPSLRNFSNEGFEKSDRRGRVFGVRFLAATVVFIDEKTSSTLV